MSTPENFYSTMLSPLRPRPYVVIVEPPSKSLRFRYCCERRSETIAAASSPRNNKIPFAIQVIGYQGRVQVVVSCVTKDPPYRPHPHNLVGQNCKKGICFFETEVTPENPTITFSKMALQCVKRKDMVENLTVREEKNIDPFMTGFGHKNNIKSIDLNLVRLCFQVFLKGDRSKKGSLTPVVSEPIYNRKTWQDPLIYRLSHCNSYVTGRQDDIILLCTKVSKDDIRIRFFEKQNGKVIWEDWGTFHPNNIFNNSAICFRPPKYRKLDITKPVKVQVQLVRPSDGLESQSVDFEYLPLEPVPDSRQKRKKLSESPLFEQFLHEVRTTQSRFSFDIPAIQATNNFIVDSSPWNLPEAQALPNIPLVLNNINLNEASGSRRTSGQDEVATWNISPGDFSQGTTFNLENANEVNQVLNFDYNHTELQTLHLSSGDLDMTDLERLSGNLQENLVM